MTEVQKITFPEHKTLIARFLNESTMVDNSKQLYAKGMQYFLDYIENKGLTLSGLDHSAIVEYRNYLIGIYKPTTAYTYFTVVRSFYKWLQSSLIYPDITAQVKAPKVKQEVRRIPFQKDEIVDMISLPRDDEKGVRDSLIILLMSSTGLRTVEIIRIRMQDVVERGSTIWVLGKGRQERTDFVNIPPKVQAKLREYMCTYRADAGQDDPLFTSTSNRNTTSPMTTKSIRLIVREAMKESGVDSSQGKLSAHSLRYFFGTEVLEMTGDAGLTMDLLRHQDMSTQKRYTQMVRNKKKKAFSVDLI